MSVSNISGKASVLISGLLVAGLLLWQLQQPEKSTTTRPARHSQPAPPLQETKNPLAVAAVALPPPPPPASHKKQPVKLKKAVTIQKPSAQKKIKPIVKVKKPSLKQVAVRAAQKPAPRKLQARTVRVSITDHSPEAKEGRTLLRLLEHGSGPEIEIAWPDGSSARSSLYHLLRSCYGMRTALMDTSGALYVTDGGRNWRPDMDRLSGFVRQPSGALTFAENKEAEGIRRRHRLGSDTTIIRLFPRRVDAVLLGGMQSLLGGRYQNAKLIHASYRHNGSRLFIDNITADGAIVRGRITFPAAQDRCG